MARWQGRPPSTTAAVDRAIDTAVDARSSGAILLNRRGTPLDRPDDRFVLALKNRRMGRLVIAIPPVSIARELWRLGEPDLASRAAALTPEEAADIGERAGDLHLSGDARRLWPEGPSGVTPALMLAAIEYLEGNARPCRRSRRLPEKQLPQELHLSESERWVAVEPVSRELARRLHGAGT